MKEVKRAGRYGVVYRRVLCPFCGSGRHRVVRTMPPANSRRVRYHVCRGCGGRFRSVEDLQVDSR